MPTYLLIGASRGLGGSTAQHLADKGAEILGVSRSPAIAGTWIEADVGTDQGALLNCGMNHEGVILALGGTGTSQNLR